MKICACSSEVETHWPSPDCSRSSSAMRMPSAQNSPAERSAIGMPTRTGPWPGMPVIDISPPMPCAIWSKPGRSRVGAVLAEAGDAAVDDALVDLLQRLVVDAEPVLHVGPEVLDHDVGLLDQPQERGAARRVLQVERDAALVAVQVLEVGALARAARSLAAALVRRHLDLDDVGAPVGELAHAGRAGAHAGQVETVKRASA